MVGSKDACEKLLLVVCRPQLVCAACSTLFQQWTGINTIIFYAPQLFLSLGVSSALDFHKMHEWPVQHARQFKQDDERENWWCRVPALIP